MVQEPMFKTVLFIFASFAILTTLYVQPLPRKNLVYVPLGDSYTIGTGVTEQERWPNQLELKLRTQGYPYRLLVNPARNGYTTQDLMNEELPVLRNLKPDLVSLQIGVNDWVQGLDEKIFRRRFSAILDAVMAALNKNGRLVVLTIPDFGVTPRGRFYGGGRNIQEGISTFNKIIREETEKRQLMLADVFEMSRAMGKNPELVAADGLHPSGKEYSRWSDLVYQVLMGDLR